MDDALRWKRFSKADNPSDAPPRAETTARFGGQDDEPILIAIIEGLVDIELARSALQDAGLPALIKRNSLGPIYGLSGPFYGTAEVWAVPALAEQTRDVLIGVGLLAEPDSDTGVAED